MSSKNKGDKSKAEAPATAKAEALPPPERKKTDPTTPHYEVWLKVKEALMALPLYFETETIIEGLHATDIFNLNSVLGATIESQVVQTLNRMRSVWDVDDKYTLQRQEFR
jgi:hypothetical protein